LRVAGSPFRFTFALLPLLFVSLSVPSTVFAQKAAQHFEVRGYSVKGESLLYTNAVDLSRYTGTNVTASEIVNAAWALKSAYRAQGFTNVTVSVAPERATDGIVTMYVFRTPVPQILVSGNRYTNAPETVTLTQTLAAQSTTSTNATVANRTNAVPHFPVLHYQIIGDTLLETSTLMSLLVKYTGTNMTVEDIKKAATDLQLEYRARGFPTVKVTLPLQTITNGVVKMQVIEGRIEDIVVSGNRFFSSNNIMRALPSLHTNTILRAPIFQAELDRANANQDRQIYPEIEPGSQPGTSDLLLVVKDRLPLHGKMEFNNESSPGTPELRLNSSLVYDNLWQHEHSLGVQYSCSPEDYKSGNQWAFYDLPLVANYSAFYRLPLGNPESVSDVVATRPGSFGFNEGTRQFQLPAPSGRSELNLYASRSTIDTGLETLRDEVIYNVPGVRQVSRQDVQQDLTINEDVGFRLSEPLGATAKWRSTFSGGLDYKTYSLTSNKTNTFSFTEITVDASGRPNPPIVSSVSSPVPTTYLPLDYLPLALRYDANLRDDWGMTFFGLGFTVNTWFKGSKENLQQITGSTESAGNWVTLTPSISRDFNILKNWVLTLRADGQWSSEPLISTERYSLGGVNNIRGYREGEIFGDTGWHVGFEQKTPTHVIGIPYGKALMTIRGAAYMDYGEAYLLDGAPARTPLWGTGFGTVISVGPHWETRWWFSWPLLTAGTTDAYHTRINFSLSGQF
jgi:hemolysin activation/secretion protein